MKGTVIPLLKNKARLNLHPLTLSSSIQPTYASAGHSRQYPNHTISMQLYTTMAFIAFSRTNSWILCQMGSPEVDTVVNESLSSMLQAMSMEIIHKTPLFIITAVISITLACRFYRFINGPHLQLTTNSNLTKYYHSLRAIWPPMSSIHSSHKRTGKRGNKLVNVAQTAEYTFYHIHRVNLEEGVVVAHLILTWEDKEDAQELKGFGTTIDVNHLPCKYTVSTFWLQLVVGDNVKVIAGVHKGTYSTIIDVLVEEGYIQVIPYGGNNDQHASWFLLVVNSSLTETTVAHPVLVAWNTHRPRCNISL